MGYHVFKLLSDEYKLQEDKTCDGKINKSGELVSKAQYTNHIQYST